MTSTKSRNSAVLIAILAAALLAAWTLRREEVRRQALVRAQLDDDCRLARFRLAQGGEFWSARIMANRCAAAGR